MALDAFFENWRGAQLRLSVAIREKSTIKISLNGAQWKHEIIEIYAASASQAPWPTLGTAHHIPADPGSDDTFNFIRRCIQGCITNPNHTACRYSSGSTLTAPKRLLDVGRAASPIRLVDTRGKSFQYIALSHCWGTDHMFSTTKTNWSQFASHILFDELPPLYQDAIIITRQLGLRYIWIDSLCIIQDSLRDWETESSKMASIYQNSYVTIAATQSSSGDARCLTARRKAIKIPYANTMKKEFALRARKILDHHPNRDADGGPATPQGPLQTRSWALQEHVLSTRIIHYTATELLFECKTSYRCECMPERKAWPTTPSLIPRAVASKRSWAVWQAWQRIVEQYAKRNLTIACDKLPAISGIASKIRKATHSDYLAGLWKSNLASDLMWHASHGISQGPMACAPQEWRAPAFSWASLDTAVTYAVLDEEEQETFVPTLTLLSSTITPTGLNPLGTISSGSLTIRAVVVPATLFAEHTQVGWIYTLWLKGITSIQMTPDCLLVQQNLEREDGKRHTTVSRAQAQDALHDFTAPVRCVSVARHDNVVSGLVVGMSLQDHSALVWKRIGTFAAGSEALQDAIEEEMILA